MNNLSTLMLKALATKSATGPSLLPFLPEAEQEAFRIATAPETIDFPSLLSSTAWIRNIHYSWFVGPIGKLPSETQAQMLPLFDQESSIKLKQMLGLSVETKASSPLALAFLSHYLKEQMMEKEILPLWFLPPSPLNKLLTLKKEELEHLIGLLGIYDLAAELRHIVDRNLLTKIHGALTSVQLQFLHYAAKQPMKWTPQKLNIERWDQDKNTLNALLHKRGLFRIAFGVADMGEHFQWHLVHHLDTGRGDYLMKLFAGKEDPAMITYFKSQVLHLLGRYR